MNLQEYNHTWAQYFKEESSKVKGLLGSNCVAVVHIGSTIIKNVKARPIIDMMVLVKDIFDVDEKFEELEAAGYEQKEKYGPLGRYLFVKKGEVISYQLQFYENGDYDDIQKIIAFRDYVEAHEEAAKEFTALKIRFEEDDEAYKEAKGEFVRALMKDAIVWHEQKHKKDMSITIGVIFGIIMGLLVGFVSSNIIFGIGAGVLFTGAVYYAFLGAMKKKKQE